jgi:hypothetical protein
MLGCAISGNVKIRIIGPIAGEPTNRGKSNVVAGCVVERALSRDSVDNDIGLRRLEHARRRDETRYNKPAANHLVFLQLAAVGYGWLLANESSPQ